MAGRGFSRFRLQRLVSIILGATRTNPRLDRPCGANLGRLSKLVNGSWGFGMIGSAVRRFVVPILAGIGAVSLITVLAAGTRESVRDTLTVYACEWHFLSEATCYTDTARSGVLDRIISEGALEADLDRELAPILAEQKAIEARNRQWEENKRSSDLDVQKAFILGCERDKLSRMKDRKDVSSIDCRKSSPFR